MILKQVLEIFELIDKPTANGEEVVEYIKKAGADSVFVKKISTEKGNTDFVKIIIKGKNGKLSGGNAPTLGVIGRLGGIGARPEMIGTVSDADGAIAALSVALKAADMKTKGDLLLGDLIITTHICPNAPTQPHDPVPFMGSPVNMQLMNEHEVDNQCDAFLSIDTTKGNKIINTRGIAISPTVKEGYILKVSDNLLDIMQIVTGKLPKVFAISQQDITPYGNGVHHLNSILQPSTATCSPVVGIAITTEVPVPGCATGASHPEDIELAGRFTLEVAKMFGQEKCSFYDINELEILLNKYGNLKKFQTFGE